MLNVYVPEETLGISHLEQDSFNASSHGDDFYDITYCCLLADNPELIAYLIEHSDSSAVVIAKPNMQFSGTSPIRLLPKDWHYCAITCSSLMFTCINQMWRFDVYSKESISCEAPVLKPYQPSVYDAIWDLRGREIDPEEPFDTLLGEPYSKELTGLPCGFVFPNTFTPYKGLTFSATYYRLSWTGVITLEPSVQQKHDLVLVHPHLNRRLTRGELSFIAGFDALPEHDYEVFTSPPVDMLNWVFKLVTTPAVKNELIQFLNNRWVVTPIEGRQKEFYLGTYYSKLQRMFPQECEKLISSNILNWKRYADLRRD